jgi:NAD/NADP transhydrogenase alpha subunit
MKNFKQIIVVKETHQDEKRVALTPAAVEYLVSKGYRVFIEKEAGLKSDFHDTEYIKAGGKIFSLTSSGFPSDTFIVRVLRPSKERELLENKMFHDNTAMLGFLFPFVADNHIQTWCELGLTTLSFDLLKATVNDPKNAQAAMSRIAGRLAFQHAQKTYRGDKPIKLTVIGPGAAGMSAAFEAIKYGIPVQMFGRNENPREELESAGIKYHVLSGDIEDQVKFIRAYLSEQNIVITAARSPGKRAPLLIDEESLSRLPHHAVIVDLAISNGGNVVGSKHDQTINLSNGKSIINVSGYPKTEPRTASEAYASCVIHLITEILTPKGELFFSNKLVQQMWVTYDRQLHTALYETYEKPLAGSTNRCRL